jgi:thiamine transport system substrate-binding protein
MRSLQNTTFLQLVLLAVLLVACQPISTIAPAASSEPAVLVLASHDSFNVSEEVIAAFEESHNAKLQVLALGDAGEAVNKIILSKDAPLADVFFGVDNTYFSRAIDAGIFVPYASPLLDAIPAEFKLDSENRLLPVDYGFVNINADKNWFDAQSLPLPATLDDLVKPEYANLLVAPNPATSSPGLAFLLTTVAYFGEEGYLDFWQALRDNGVLITDGWSEAYFEHFTVGSAGSGDRPLVVSYSTSPPADIVYATDGRTEPASVNISPPNATFRQIEFAGILAGTKQTALAQSFIDFLLDEEFQADIPLQMFVYPVNPNVQLPDLFVQFGQVPPDPVHLTPEAIDANREAWIEAWTNVMLR